MTDETNFEDEDGEGYELLMPFVVTKSHGGPWDDESFVAGWELGRLDAALGQAEGIDFTRSLTVTAQIRTDGVPQAELIAMKHGFVLTAREVDPGVAPGWSILDITREV
jgi:hypothetical protein